MSAKRLGVAAAVAIAVLASLAVVGFGAYALGRDAGRAEALAAVDFPAAAADSTAAAGDGGAGAVSAARSNPYGVRSEGGALAAESGGSFAGGEVVSVSGDVIELSTATEVLRVKVDDQTQIQRTLSGSIGDLQPGERVVIQGERAADGTLVARSIQVGSFGPWGGRGAATPPASK